MTINQVRELFCLLNATQNIFLVAGEIMALMEREIPYKEV